MPKVANFTTIANIRIDDSSYIPLHRQLYEAVRQEILSGGLKPGTRLPSTRAFAKELGVSRNTVSSAFTQLLMEGYVESKVGSGTRVNRRLPEEMLLIESAELRSPKQPIRQHKQVPIVLSERGEAILKIPHNWENRTPSRFNAALPDVSLFPIKEWERCLVTAWRELASDNLGYSSAQGYEPLRVELADYLQQARGVRCSAENIIITNGAQQAVTITANLLLNRDDSVWVENPCYPGIRAALSGAIAKAIAVPVDQDGLNVDIGAAMAPQAKLIYVSPSHQYPLGVTMSLARRLQLLQWAEANDAWIVEDDYDSEYRYSGYPVPAVQGMDQAGRVIYVGTFSKMLFPALRIGYLVLPDALVKPFHAARAHADRGSSLLEQAALARFIASGYLNRHIRRMRTKYAEQQTRMIELIDAELGELIEISGTDAGLHFVLGLPDGVDDGKVSAELMRQGIRAPSLSSFALTPIGRGGLVLGFATLADDEIDASVRGLCQTIRSFC